MKRTLWLMMLVFAAFARRAGASGPEPRATATRAPSLSVSAWMSFRTGVVDAPYPSETLGEVHSGPGQTRLFRFGAAGRIAPNLWVGAHAAHLWAGVEQPAGSYRATNLWGNPLVFATLSRSDLWQSMGTTLDADVSLGVGVPLAAERAGPDEQLDRRALSIGDALEGMTDPEIFTPHVLPFELGGSLVWSREYFQLRLALELPWLLRLSEDAIPDGASTSFVGFVPNAEIRGTVWPWKWLGLSLGTTLAWPLVAPVYLASPRGDPQAMLAPSVVFALGGKVLVSFDVGVAAGGPASGTASAELSARLAL